MVNMILTGSLLQNSIKLFGLVILFILIIVACYYVTRFVGSKNMGTMKENNIKLIDIYRINQNQCLMIVNVGTRYFLVASGKDTINLLSEISGEELCLHATGKPVRFQDVFSSFVKKQEGITEENKDDTAN